MKEISAENLGGLLFSIHRHIGEFVKNEKHLRKSMIKYKDGGDIIYREDDIIKLLVFLGYPEPIWGKSITLAEYYDLAYFEKLLNEHDFCYRSSDDSRVYDLGLAQEMILHELMGRNPKFQEMYEERIKKQFKS